MSVVMGPMVLNPVQAAAAAARRAVMATGILRVEALTAAQLVRLVAMALMVVAHLGQPGLLALLLAVAGAAVMLILQPHKMVVPVGRVKRL